MLEYVSECETKKWLATIKEWKEEHPLMMKKKPIMTPQDVIETINRIFDEAIIVTDVDSIRCLRHSLSRSRKRKTSDVRRSWNYGIWYAGSYRCEDW